jgi:hypothetical protein
MHTFHGDLLIGGMAILNVNGLFEQSSVLADSPSPEWSGQFTIDRCQQDDLELGRQYLLLLDDGRNREVMLTDIHPVDDDEASVICEFADCRCRTPK